MPEELRVKSEERKNAYRQIPARCQKLEAREF